MAQVIQANELTLHEIKTQFNFQPAESDDFFWEWQDPLPAITATEQQALDRVKADFFYLDRYPG